MSSVFAACGLVYANSLGGAFLFDDLAAIVDNPSIRSLWPPWAPLLPPLHTAPARSAP